MAITAADLLAPTGALTPELLLPLRSLVTDAATASDVATAYAAAGTAKVSAWPDPARAASGAIAWAHYRALMDRAQQIQAQALSAGAEGASEAFSTAQAVELKKDAALYLAAFEAAAPAVDGGGAAATVGRPLVSRATPVTVLW